MGALAGLGIAAGATLVWMAVADVHLPRSERLERRRRQLREALTRAELSESNLRALVGGTVVAMVMVFLLVLSLTRAWTVSLATALVIVPLPFAWVNGRIRRRHERLRAAWPDVADFLLSSVRAGVNLPEAVLGLAHSGPEATRSYFTQFAREYRTNGRFDEALEIIQEEVLDPVADRLFEALRLARAVGGSELGNLLRDLSTVMREDARVRGEILARQSWTVNAARLAVAAPWVVLVLLSTRIDAARAYLTPTGVWILALGAAGCAGAYWLMRRIARLEVGETRRTWQPTEARAAEVAQ